MTSSHHRPSGLSAQTDPLIWSPLWPPPLTCTPGPARTPPHLHRAFRSGPARQGSRPSALRQNCAGAAGAEAGPAQAATGPVTRGDSTNAQMHDLPLASQAAPTTSQMGSLGPKEAHAPSHSAVKRARAGCEASKSWSASLCSPHPVAHTQWAPGAMTQLMSGVINTSTFPTAPTCPTWLPFLLMSRPGAGGQDAWVCVENIAWTPPQPALAQGPLSTSGSHTEL